MRWHGLTQVTLEPNVCLVRRRLETLPVQSCLKLETLQPQHVNAVDKRARPTLHVRPAVGAPEWILANSNLKCLEPKVKVGQAAAGVEQARAEQVAG